MNATTPQTLAFLAILFTAFALMPAAAHALELPNKIRLGGDQYLTVQKLYRGWEFAGIAVVAALVSTLALSLANRDEPNVFGAALIACLCIAATQVIFWTLTFPVNRQTRNWTYLPKQWERLRKRWEYSHVVSALFNLTAFLATLFAALGMRSA